MPEKKEKVRLGRTSCSDMCSDTEGRDLTHVAVRVSSTQLVPYVEIKKSATSRLAREGEPASYSSEIKPNMAQAWREKAYRA